MQIPEEFLMYQITLNNNPILTGNVFEAATIVVTTLLMLIALAIYFGKGLRENSRMKYEFITIVAHKFRTPLTYVKWVCDSLVSDETDSFKKESIENIKKSNQKLIDLTGTLIEIADSDSSGTSTYVYKKIVVCDLAKNVANNLKDTFHEKNIIFGFNCNKPKAMIWADQARLEFVMTTLLENACTYTPPAKTVDINISANLFYVHISVEDTGIGIAKKDLPNIFTKFFRGQNARQTDTEGFGVGLCLASSIIHHLHGKIRVDSKGENLGSKFTITLPRVR
jgi:signal transduction histidine kinase